MLAELSDPSEHFAEFVSTFPCTLKAAGASPWDASHFDRWAASTPISSGELATARFLLALWDPDCRWESGRFDLMEAMRVWDDRHYRAFLAWAEAPWWP